MSYEPASSLIAYLGGAKAVSEIVGKHCSRVYRWTYSADKREGTGGLVPSRDQQKLMDWAADMKFDLQPVDFFSPDRIKLIMAEKARELEVAE